MRVPRHDHDADVSPDAGQDPDADAGPDAAELRCRLLAFYDARRRDLPWRDVDDPYRTWVSEVMLQQTRVETVVPYYRKWVERFPDVEALADAGGAEVLKAWEGLGYYSRARNLHRAARLVVERHGGELPAGAEELRELPGVGPYTAGAVASIAFGEAVPAVDGNARRVLARLFDLPDPTPAELAALAAGLVDPERPGDFNQALMELGATVCTPREAACPGCPLEDACLARARGTVDQRPAPRKRDPVPRLEFGVAVVTAGARVLVVRRPEDGLLGGMWEFPGEEASGDEPPETAARRAARGAGVDARGEPVALEPVEHAYSHFRGTYRPFLFRVREAGTETEERRWVTRSELEELPLPRAQQRIARHLDEVSP